MVDTDLIAKHKLTKNQVLVLATLFKAKNPLSAYSILDLLRDVGFRAPLQVYRALDRLTEHGLVHRLESLNAFMACGHLDCSTHPDAALFTICDKCGMVAEINDRKTLDTLSGLAADSGFRVTKSTIELNGVCKDCDATTASREEAENKSKVQKMIQRKELSD